MTDTAKLAHVVFADVPSYAKTGTYTNAERRVNRLHAALEALGDARPALLALTDLANALEPTPWSYAHPDAVTDEIAQTVPGYERFTSQYELWGKARIASRNDTAERTAVRARDLRQATPPASADGDAAPHDRPHAVHEPRRRIDPLADADKLHREEFVEIHPADAADLRVNDEDELTLVTDNGELTVRCKISPRVLEGVLFLSAYYDGGAITRLLSRDGAPAAVRVKVATPA